MEFELSVLLLALLLQCVDIFGADDTIKDSAVFLNTDSGI